MSDDDSYYGPHPIEYLNNAVGGHNGLGSPATKLRCLSISHQACF